MDAGAPPLATAVVAPAEVLQAVEVGDHHHHHHQGDADEPTCIGEWLVEGKDLYPRDACGRVGWPSWFSWRSHASVLSLYSWLSVLAVCSFVSLFSLGASISFASLFSLNSFFSVLSINSVSGDGCAGGGDGGGVDRVAGHTNAHGKGQSPVELRGRMAVTCS